VTSSGSESTRDVAAGSGSEGHDSRERSPMKPDGCWLGVVVLPGVRKLIGAEFSGGSCRSTAVGSGCRSLATERLLATEISFVWGTFFRVPTRRLVVGQQRSTFGA
jgi:hypothetical protein